MGGRRRPRWWRRLALTKRRGGGFRRDLCYSVCLMFFRNGKERSGMKDEFITTKEEEEETGGNAEAVDGR